MARKLLIDMDPGVDDALALCVALAAPELDVVAVTATGGNVPPARASHNVQGLVEQLDPARRPRIGCAATEHASRTDGTFLHGSDGLCGANLPVAELVHRHSSLKVMCEEVRLSPGNVTLVATGPLTNVADMLRADPLAGEQLGHVVFVGGTIGGPGNITAAAEFNIYCDAESARQVFHSKTTKTMLPVDISSRLVLGYELLDIVKNGTSRTAALLQKILPGAYHSYRQRLGIEGIYVHDAIAIIAVLHPEWFETVRLYGDVETAGELTHGMTIFDRRSRPEQQANIDVIVDMDIDEVHADIVSRLERAE